MSVRTNPHGGSIESETTLSTYDLLLALLPLPLAFGVLGATFTSLPLAFGAGLGGLPSALLLAYGLFVASPTRTGTDGSSSVASNRRT